MSPPPSTVPSVHCGMVAAAGIAPWRRRKRATNYAATNREVLMRRLIVALVAFTALALPAYAQPAPDSENGRYTFSQAGDQTLRLDTRTGAVSLCAKKDAGWSCAAVPDERSALESEIARLQRENGALKKDMIARGLPLPNAVTGLPAAPGDQRELQLKVPLPSDAEIDRVMSAFERMWRRLIEMVQKTPTGDKI
jgi:hypothetical protein